MAALFDIAPSLPNGFTYFPAFISREEEKELCRQIDGIELHTFVFQGFEAKRKAASFGYDWSFDRRKLSKGKEIPPFFHPLMEKVAKKIGLQKEDFAELLVLKYPIGAVINWHRDAPPFGLIAGISLRTDCTFKLRPYDKIQQGRNSILSLPVEKRSLYVMQGEVRSEWEHSTAPVEDVRYSITLRTLMHPDRKS